MKRIILIALCLILSILLISCGSAKTEGNDNTSATEADNVTDSTAAVSESAEAETTTTAENVEYKTGETWTVDGQWELTINGIEETADRNEFSDKTPAAVYVVSFTWKNTGYVDEDGLMDGLYMNIDDTIIDSQGTMGYSYPGDVTDYPTETPVGATCNGQVCIGVDNAGTPIKLIVTQYDGNGVKQTATFVVG